MSGRTWVIYFILLIVALYAVDAGFRIVLWKNSSVEVVNLDSTNGRHDTVTVYIPGLVADGVYSSRNQVDELRRHGDVWLVVTKGDRYKDQELARMLASMLQSETRYTRIRFLTSSLGTHGAMEVMEQFPEEMFEQRDIALIGMCPPSGGLKDIKRPDLKFLAAATKFLKFGPGANKLFGDRIVRSITGEQERKFTWTYYTDQVNYVRTRPDPNKKILGKIKVVVIVAGDDELIGPDAYKVWTTGDAEVITLPGMKHASFEDDYEVWNQAIREAYGFVNAS